MSQPESSLSPGATPPGSDAGGSDGRREEQRLATVRRLVATGAGSDRLRSSAQLAADILGTRFAQVSLLLEHQVIAALAGDELTPERQTGPAGDSLCSVTMAKGAPLVVPEAAAEPSVNSLPPVTSGAVGSYLGVPLVDSTGTPLGAFCVYDSEPRVWTPHQVSVLSRLADGVVAELELHAVTAELRTSATRLDLALGAASIGSFELDPATGALSWDTRLMELFGYSPATFVPHLSSFSAKVHPDDRDRVVAAVAQALDTRGELQVEYRIVVSGSVTRWISARGRVVVDETGAGVRLLGAAYDATARHDARDEAVRILESMQDAFFRVDRDWRFTYVNAQAERVLLRSRDELIGHSIWEEFPGAARDTEFWHKYHEAVETGEVRAFEAHYPVPLDAWFEVTAWPGTDGLGVYFRDVTERRRAEADREAAISAREQSAADRERAALAAAAAGDRLALLAEMTRVLVSTLDVDEALARLTRLVVPRLADWASVTLLDAGGKLRHSVARHSDPRRADDVRRFTELHVEVASPESNSQRVVRTGEPVLHETIDPASAALGWDGTDLTELLGRLGLATLMVVPLKARDRTLGVVVFAGGPERAPFTRDDLETAVELGRRAGLAVDNAQLYGAQRAAAETMQRSLLTEMPQPDRLEIVARYLPAAQEAAVGGDWHDAAVQPDGSTVLSIGDVMGHDIAAAAAMGQVRTLLRGIAYDSQATPASVLRRVDAALRGLQVDTLATAVVARIEQSPAERMREVRRVRWSNAGHLPPVLLRADGTVTELPGGDLLLGLDPGTARTDQELILEPGDTLLLYTDGLVERRDSDLDRGLARLRQALTGSGDSPLETLCDDLLARLVPAERDDDVALIAVRVHPEDRPRPAEAGPPTVPPEVD